MKRDAGSSGGSAHVDQLLDAFGSGELEAAERARVEEHLARCARCREELAATAAWSDAFDRAFAARRAAAAELEPDWAAQRAAIVARTSARQPGGRRSPFWRWAPQITLVAVAALIVGIVWRENPREEPVRIGSRASERASADSRTTEPSAGMEREEADLPAAPPPAEREERFGEERAADLAKARDEDAVLHEAVPEAALGAAQRAATLAPIERFRFEAREALAARDTAAARRMLRLWSDTLAPRGDTLDQRGDPDGRPGALADSLRELLDIPVAGSPGSAE